VKTPVQAAEAVEPAGGEPPHAEAAGDATVTQIEEVAQRAWDVFQAWEGVWDGGNIRDLNDPRRRLRWALDHLPNRLRGALPAGRADGERRQRLVLRRR
jgi:hypothetical protein